MADKPNYLDPKTIDRVANLELRARLIVEGYITGMHKSPYNGFAVEFATHREYVPGDEIKHIDWKVWSRTDRYYIKEYEEETNLQCTILLDCSKSMRYGSETDPKTGASKGISKFDYAATCTASLAHMLRQQQDSVGLVLFDNEVRLNLPAKNHPSHLRLLIHELEKAEPDNRTDVGDIFRRLAEQIPKRGLVVLISDLFVDMSTLTQAMRHFRHRKHEVVVFHMMHEDELTFPFQDNTRFKGLETPVELLTEPRALRDSYLKAIDRFQQEVRKACASSGIDYVLMNTKDPLHAVLANYLAFRQRTQRVASRR
jgi:uncharacterized protein (DUF58 family)